MVGRRGVVGGELRCGWEEGCGWDEGCTVYTLVTQTSWSREIGRVKTLY